jgi:hypothetical protein
MSEAIIVALLCSAVDCSVGPKTWNKLLGV